MIRFAWTAIGSVFMVALAGCAGADGKTGGGAGGPGGAPAMPVEVALVRQDTVVDAIQATGQVEAIQSIELRSDVEGRITEILMREGSEVAAGAPLFRIDDAELRAQVARAEAERDLARQALERTRGLLAQNASSAADLERAEATSRSTQAQLELLKIRLDRTVVRAPFGGVLGQRLVSLGDYVTTSTALVSLQTVDPERVSFTVPERYARVVSVGQGVEFQVAALPGERFVGRVEFIDPVVQLPARTLLIKARVPNGRRHLQAGMFVESRIVTATRPRALVIPEEAVLALQGQYIVWVIADGKANRRPVELGVRRPGEVEITSGVSAGEQVVIGGLEILRDGMPAAPTVVERKPAERKE